MIKLELQMFGGGSSGGGGAGGGGTNASKSTSKQAVSSNAPGSGHGKGGGRRMDGAPVKRDELREQPVTTQQRRPEGSRESATRVASKVDYKTNLTAVADNERYDLYITKNGKEKLYQSGVKGSRIRKQMTYSKTRESWIYKNTKFNVRRTKTK